MSERIDVTLAKAMLSELDDQTRVSGTPTFYEDSKRRSLELLNKLPSILTRLGIQMASVSLIRADGKIAFGASRIPFLIETPFQKLVAKTPETDVEKEIQFNSQMHFQDGLAPKIIEATNGYLIEEYIDPITSPSLHEIALREGLTSAARRVIPALIRLIKEGYVFTDLHLFDEFRLRNKSDSIVLIDWGMVERIPIIETKSQTVARDNATIILTGNWGLLSDDIRSWLSDNDLTDDQSVEAAMLMESDTFLFCKRNYPKLFNQIGEKYRELRVDTNKLEEVIYANKFALINLATFLENTGQSDNKWRDVWPYFSEFVTEFVAQYNKY